jgi:hypothetical protein
MRDVPIPLIYVPNELHADTIGIAQSHIAVLSRSERDDLRGVRVLHSEGRGGRCLWQHVEVRASGPRAKGIYGSPKAASRARHACRGVRPSRRRSPTISE